MKYRTMRFIGGEENVSLLGLGCMRFPLNEDGTIDEAQAEAMIGRALNAGINYIDTAYLYHKGESEPFLGRALKKYPRNSFYLATKLPVWLVNSVEDAERLFKEQLSRLQTKYIDYYLLHALDAGRWEEGKRKDPSSGLFFPRYIPGIQRDPYLPSVGFLPDPV